jgi:protein O-mannosyl-transferase
VTERKDVLSTLFLIMAVGAYHRYAQCAKIRHYALALLAFLCGLMAKPTLVTFPFALLLLDYWPLGRLRLGQALTAEQAALPCVRWWRLLLEKIPFFAASALFSRATLEYSRAIGAVMSLSLPDRLAICLSGYLSYLEKTLWPTDLAAVYPLLPVPGARVVIAAIVLAAITLAVTWVGRRRPAVLVGWLWFVGTLFPVSGIAQTGPQAFADRFTYVPHIGLAIMVVWGLGDLPVWHRLSEGMRRGLIGLVLVGLGSLTWMQVCYWQNSGVLFVHALSVTEKNFDAHYYVGLYFMTRGDLKQAEDHAAKAVEIAPKLPRGQLLLANVLIRQGNYARASNCLDEFLRLEPTSADGYYALGLAMYRQGNWQKAKENLQRSVGYWASHPPTNQGTGDLKSRQAGPLELLGELALRDGHPDDAVNNLARALLVKPDLAEAHFHMGVALGRLGDWPRAEAALLDAVALESTSGSYRGYLASAYAQQKKSESAAREYARILDEDPDWLNQTNDLAMRSITIAPFLDRTLAEELALQICEATAFKDPRWLNTLAAVQAAKGRFDAACATTQKAIGLAADQALRAELEDRLRMYERKQALPIKALHENK